jgi:hypothetical protein
LFVSACDYVVCLFCSFGFSAAHRQDLSRDSLCSESTDRSSSALHSPSQASFTSLERLEIRHLIKTLKSKGMPSFERLHSTTVAARTLPTPSASRRLPPSLSMPAIKQQQSSITEELEQKFARLRSMDPQQDLIYVKPSLIHRQDRSPLLSVDNRQQQVCRRVMPRRSCQSIDVIV